MSKTIGNINFSEHAYQRFVSLPKEKQVEKVYNSLSPKDMKLAEKLLQGVPNAETTNQIEVNEANISSGNEQEAQEDNGADATGGNGGHTAVDAKADKGSKRNRANSGKKS